MFGNKYGIDFKEDINRRRVFKVLLHYKNKEVNAWKLSFDSRVLHYTMSVMELRERGFKIQNRLEQKGKVRHSFYKLILE